MTLDELNAFIEERDAIYRAAKDGNISERERILARTVKVMEEAGELADEVLASLGHQRKAKMENRAPDALAEEFSDTVITIFLLAKTMGVDLPSALEKKIEKIRTRDGISGETAPRI